MGAPDTNDARAVDAVTAATIMTSPVICVNSTMTLPEVWQLMRRHRVPRVVVSDGRVPLGIVDQLDVLTAWGTSPTAPRAVLTVLTATPCLSPDSTLPEVCRALLQAHHEAAMVLDVDGHLRGIVSLDDVLPALSASRAVSC
jgi:CBS domain-containing protein